MYTLLEQPGTVHVSYTDDMPMHDSATGQPYHPRLLALAIGLTGTTCLLAFFVWGHMYDWQLGHLSPYQLFPLFGLLAFSIMWSQYMVEAVKNYHGQPDALPRYFRATGWLVLVAILLHPSILIAARFQDGYGLPPGSYTSYVAPTKEWLVLLGSICLLIFLAFELKRWFWQKSWWHYVRVVNDIAIVAIFYHGLRLGQNLQAGWYQVIWYIYGVLLLTALVYKYLGNAAKRDRVLTSR